MNSKGKVTNSPRPGSSKIRIKANGRKIVYDRITIPKQRKTKKAPEHKHIHEYVGYDKLTGKSFQYSGGENDPKRSYNKNKKRKKKKRDLSRGR